MDKKLLITISLVTTSLLFSACGGGGSSSSEKTSLVPEDTTEYEESGENQETTPEEEENTNQESDTTEEENLEETSNEGTESSENETTIDISSATKEPYYKYAWHLESANSVLNDQGYTVNQNADINVTEAWKITMGLGVKVAVIDDGADVTHEDLKSNLLVAYNADDGTSDINANSDEASHGNTCAGFIVAPINSKGTVGVAPESKLIAIKQNEQSDANVIKAFEYAKNQGAKVISCSWGTENVSDIVVSELKSLYDSGITVLFASGNNGKSLDEDGLNDESEVEWVIGVGSSVENNDVGSYSNYGKNIEVIAPGGDTEESSGILGLDDMGEHGGTNQLDLVSNNYSFTDGTSFATPVTAGVVALMYAANPNITPAQIRDILITTTFKVGEGSQASYDANGFDEKRAYGKVNAGRAVAEAKKLGGN
ncbi:MAG: S8 family serine peptidase [Epsilonproteobacteria bacterium]|nr:S8 family serine peptidase [Campylobacterota bacterium]